MVYSCKWMSPSIHRHLGAEEWTPSDTSTVQMNGPHLILLRADELTPLWHTVWIFEIGSNWIFIMDQWQFIYIFIVLILSVSFYYEVPSEPACNPHIMKITTISFYAVSASPCQCLIRPVQKPKVSWFFGLFFHWLLNYTRGRAFRREISKIHRVCPKIVCLNFCSLDLLPI